MKNEMLMAALNTIPFYIETFPVSQRDAMPKRQPVTASDLEEEYNLIQSKKSTLSATERRRLVYKYEALKGDSDEQA